MDIFSHGLYGGVAFGRMSRRDYITAFLFGIAPDLLAFGTLFITSLISTGTMGRPNLESIPSYVFSVYDFSHSLVVYAVFFAILWFFGYKHFAKLTLAWPLHILVDIPTHDATFFPTPFLWPISDFHIYGVSWGHPMIFIPNIILLLSLYLYWYTRRRKW
ncbi:MAG: hypothetical protein EXS50_02650 [Candidatus Taylorbacteria bacterium]|nr:hypothetical protein [Candidatus Taylorbacteria bacterium]